MRSTTSRAGSATEQLRKRLDDPDEPLYTMAVARDLLGADAQRIRRLDALGFVGSTRSDGNHRRYSRNDLLTIVAAMDLQDDGVPPSAIPRVLELENKLSEARSDQ